MKTYSRQDMNPQEKAAILRAAGPDGAADLRALADDIQDDGRWIFGEIHAERLRMLADKLDAGTETAAVQAQAEALLAIWYEHVAIEKAVIDGSVATLTTLLRNLAEQTAGGHSPITFVFTRCENCGNATTAIVLDVEIASELAMLLSLVDDTELRVEVAA